MFQHHICHYYIDIVERIITFWAFTNITTLYYLRRPFTTLIMIALALIADESIIQRIALQRLSRLGPIVELIIHSC